VRVDWNELQFKTVGLIGYGFLGAYFPFVRCVREGEENLLQYRRAGTPTICVFWHGQMLSLAHFHRNEAFAVLSSTHRDSEFLARVLRRLGFDLVRGSSTRGGIGALRGLIRAVRGGKDLALTPDGPKGPLHIFKPGALVAAQQTGAPIVPVGVGADRAWYLPSWDRFMIPKPFSTVRIRYNHPHWVPRDATEADRERIAAGLGEELRKMTLELNPLLHASYGEADATE
jgi:lysophospholipid acyltransferase (LPLAT)-like uncharacterized protein